MKQLSNLRHSFVGSIFLILPLYALAFQQSATALVDSTLLRQPEAIPITSVLSEIESARDEIAVNYEKIKPGKGLIRIDSLYNVYKEVLRIKEEEAKKFLNSNPNRQKIDNLILKWEEYKAQLMGWQTDITVYASRNMRLLEGFRNEGKIWNLTLEKAKEEEAPPELISSIESVIRDFSKIEQKTKQNNNIYLRLQTHINQLLDIQKSVVDALYEKKSSETYDLSYQRHPPFWAVAFGKKKPSQQVDEVRTSTLSDSLSGTPELLRTHRTRLLWFVFFGTGLFALILYIRNRLRILKPEGIEAPDSYLYLMLKMPLITGVFILLAVLKLSLASTPKMIEDFFTLALLLLGIVIVRPRVQQKFKSMLYFSILFWALNTIKTYFWFTSTNYRIFMLVEVLLFVGVLVYYVRPYRETKAEISNSLGKLVLNLVPLVYLLSAISVVSNLLGYTNLADFLLKVSLNSALMLIIAYALFLSLSSVVQGWLYQRYLRNLHQSPELLIFLKKRIQYVIRFIVAVLFVFFFLNLIDEWRTIHEAVSSFMTEPYKVGSLSFTLGSIFMFLFVLTLSYGISRLIAFFLGEEFGFMHFFKLPEGIPAAISLVLRYSIIIFGLVIALAYLNVDLSEFNLMAGALGLGIGFGLQTVVSNFISGLILVFERPILPGDTVEVNNLLGKVKKIGIRACNISTYDGAEVVVPNNNLISNDLINWTLSDSIKRVEVLIGVAYGTDPNLVLKVLKDCALKFDYVLVDPEPSAFFTGFGESSLDFRLLFWVPFEIGLRAKSDVCVEIFNQFKTENIIIPFPQRDLNIKNVSGSSGDGLTGPGKDQVS
ncbi:MAG: mechanosensitive ion channel domain-containing protein [Robiginitalea sp.]|uniref:mechanosensitive ion channel family protein n=1 Tax=Robiginitalea sp. TaxID=1902411 RepID=UPI003C7824AF